MPRIRAATLEAHGDLMRSRLLDAFAALLVERDYDAITLADVAERAGMARNTVYNYAKDKPALFAATVARANADLVERVVEVARGDGSASARLDGIVRALLRGFSDGTTRAAVLHEISGRSHAVDEWVAAFGGLFDEFAAVLEAGAATGEFRDLPDVPLMIDLISGVVGAAARRAAQGEAAIEVLEAAVVDALHRLLAP